MTALEKVANARFPDALTFRRELLGFWTAHRATAGDGTHALERATTFERLGGARERTGSDDSGDSGETGATALPMVDLSKFAGLTPIGTPREPKTPATDRRTPAARSKKTEA